MLRPSRKVGADKLPALEDSKGPVSKERTEAAPGALFHCSLGTWREDRFFPRIHHLPPVFQGRASEAKLRSALTGQQSE